MRRYGVVCALITALLVGAASPPASAQVPVLLVPGWFDTERDLAALRIRLLSAGWPVESVVALTFVRPTGSNEEHAEEIAEAVRALRESTGAPKVDVVAHSMGGLAPWEENEVVGVVVELKIST